MTVLPVSAGRSYAAQALCRFSSAAVPPYATKAAHGVCGIQTGGHALAGRATLLAMVLLSLVAWIAASDAQADAQPDLPALCHRVGSAYVFISGGSGVVFAADGRMLTNAHVIAAGKEFDVRTGDGRPFHAKLLGRNPDGDLAVLQLDLKPKETVPYLPLGDSEALHVGDAVLAVGNPFAEGIVDQNPTFTAGVVSGLNQTAGVYPDAVAIDAAVNPGNSGGPLINMAGEVVGINGQISTRWGLRSSTGLGYAISSREIRLWLPRLEKAHGGDVRDGRVTGMEIVRSEEADRKPPQIKEVIHDSPAEKYGFKAGDRIVRIDGVPIPNVVRLVQIVAMYPQDSELPVRVERDGKEVELKAKLVGHSDLGLKLAQPAAGDELVRVGELSKTSAAATAGVKNGDEIVALGPVEIKGRAPIDMQFRVLNNVLEKGVFIGDAVRIKVRRKESDGKVATPEFHLVAR